LPCVTPSLFLVIFYSSIGFLALLASFFNFFHRSALILRIFSQFELHGPASYNVRQQHISQSYLHLHAFIFLICFFHSFCGSFKFPIWNRIAFFSLGFRATRWPKASTTCLKFQFEISHLHIGALIFLLCFYHMSSQRLLNSGWSTRLWRLFFSCCVFTILSPYQLQ